MIDKMNILTEDNLREIREYIVETIIGLFFVIVMCIASSGRHWRK